MLLKWCTVTLVLQFKTLEYLGYNLDMDLYKCGQLLFAEMSFYTLNFLNSVDCYEEIRIRLNLSYYLCWTKS